jgi:predicted transcriptional regulator
MRVEKLELSRGYTYSGDTLKPLQGTITLLDANNAKLEIPLSPGAVSRLIAAISTEVSYTVREVAKNVPSAITNAIQEHSLLEHNGVIE